MSRSFNRRILANLTTSKKVDLQQNTGRGPRDKFLSNILQLPFVIVERGKIA